MKKHTNIKTAVIAIVIVALLCLLAGAARRDPLPQVGRFQIDCTNTSCYLVDTATGQVWSPGSREFYRPKLDTQPAGPPAKAEDFIGQWRADKEDVTLWLEEGGVARGASDGEEHEGTWRSQGSRVFIMIHGEAITGQIAPHGGLMLSQDEGGDEGERIHFRKVK